MHEVLNTKLGPCIAQYMVHGANLFGVPFVEIMYLFNDVRKINLFVFH